MLEIYDNSKIISSVFLKKRAIMIDLLCINTENSKVLNLFFF